NVFSDKLSDKWWILALISYVPQEALVYLGVVLGLVLALIVFGLYLYRLLCFAHSPGLRCLETKPAATASVAVRGRAFDVAVSSSAAPSAASRIVGVGCGGESLRLLRLNEPAALDPPQAQPLPAPTQAPTAWLEVSINHHCQTFSGQGCLEILVARAAGIQTIPVGESIEVGGPVSAQVVALLSTDAGEVRRLRTRTAGIGASAGGVSVFGDALSFEAVQCADLPLLTLRLRLYACPYVESRRCLLASSCLAAAELKSAAACHTNAPSRSWAASGQNSGIIRLPLIPSADQSAWDSDTGFSETSSIAGQGGDNDGDLGAGSIADASEAGKIVSGATNAAAATAAAQSLSSLIGQSELFIGLTYNQLTGQLGIEVLKGSGLRRQSSIGKPPDTMVKLCLEFASTGQALFRCKTSCASGTPHPMWKENFVFPLNKFQLVDASVFVCVFVRKPILNRQEMLGWVALGRKSSGEEEQAHWQDMLDFGGTQICRWHRLLPATDYAGPKP
uniref:C2 domain-containing protein n=1 Tax=Macrostomum lignano TaxID=282301 RepID=A0A1I8H7M0_9PLAT